MPDNESFFFTPPTLLTFPRQFHVIFFPGDFSLKLKRPGLEADGFSSSDAELKIYGDTPPPTSTL